MDHKQGYLSLLQQKKYLYVLSANTVASFGFMMFMTAFLWLAYDLTNSAVIAGFVILSSTAPYLLFGLIGGAYADRWNRKKVTLWSNGLTALAALVIPCMKWFGMLAVWHVALSACLIVSIRCFFSPAIRAMIPQVLPKDLLLAGNSLYQVNFQLTKSIAPAVAGLLIAQMDASVVFLIYSGLSAVVLFIALPLQVSTVTAEEKRSIWKDIAHTFRFVKTIKPLFWSILLFSFVLLCQNGFEKIGLPDLADNVWKQGADGFGWILTAIGIGNIVGAFLLGKVKMKTYSTYIFVSWVAWGICFAVLGTSPWYLLALAFAFLAGMVESLNDIPMMLMIQTTVPESKLGKVFSMWSTLAFIGESGSSILAGAVIGIFSLTVGFLFVGIALTSLGVLGFFLVKAKSRTEEQQVAS